MWAIEKDVRCLFSANGCANAERYAWYYGGKRFLSRSEEHEYSENKSSEKDQTITEEFANPPNGQRSSALTLGDFQRLRTASKRRLVTTYGMLHIGKGRIKRGAQKIEIFKFGESLRHCLTRSLNDLLLFVNKSIYAPSINLSTVVSSNPQ